MKILITGDFAITRPYNAITHLDKSVIDLFAQSDINIVNMEAPVTHSNNQILKTGPHLRADKKSTIDVLKKLKINIATLANNHLKDYDEQGVAETIQFCKENNIYIVGAGMNLKEAASTLFFESKGRKIAIVNFAENEWASATIDSAGVNPMDVVDNYIQIKQARLVADYVIVIIHGGHEFHNLPSPRMVKQYRFYAEQGVDFVVGHHTHCISGYEIHTEVPIFYSLGNLLFTLNSNYNKWYTGLVLEINISNSKISYQLHPVTQRKEDFRLSLLTGIKKDLVLDNVKEYSKIIQDERQLKANWEDFIDKQSDLYFNYWSPLSFVTNKYLRAILKRTAGNMLNKKTLSLYLNLIRCEAHRDISIDVIREYLIK